MTTSANIDSIDAMSLSPSNDSKQYLEISFGGFSSKGVKPENQDAFAAHQPKQNVRHFKGVVACMADGVSCSENAQQASQTSVTTFIDDYFNTPDAWTVKTSAARVLSSLNAWLYHHGQQDNARHNGLVTTFTSVILKSNTAHIVHVGDSRLYRLRSGRLEQLTRDHCHKQGKDRFFLTRALGMDSHLEVDYFQEDIEQGDLLMLSTDGVHDVLSSAELKSFLAPQDLDLEAVANAVVQTAEDKGSQDNLSCLLVRVDNLPQEDIDEVHRKLTQLTIPPVLDVGMKLDGYEVQKVIHSGSRSHLYLVKREGQEQRFVLKAPSENFVDDAQYLEGFIREQWVGRRLNHKGVMKIYPHDANSPFLYHLCEYIEGQTLRQWMYDNPNPSLDQVRSITKQLIVSLRAFQRLSMVHRDLKPENIMLDSAGNNVQIIDFGTVQVSGLEEIYSPLEEECPVGSVDYIAPEYLLGEGGVHRSDIFSLGVIIYEMLVGKLPFKVSSIPQQIPSHYDAWQYISVRKHRRELPAWVDLALKKATSPSPTHRYSVMSEMLQDLTVPNKRMIERLDSAPLLERNPVRFWQLISAVLVIVIVAQGIFLGGN